jgi:geranylgeranyl diphosphate synthase type I
MSHDKLYSFLKDTNAKITRHFETHGDRKYFRPEHIFRGVMSYLLRPAKRLRPGVMMMCCGCYGGEEKVEKIIPAAAALELFHTWTLTHDDIIDNDELRRGNATVHVDLRDAGVKDLALSGNMAEEYGRSAAILAGDVQHGWVVSSFLELAQSGAFDAGLIVAIVKELESRVLGDLICGEMLDVQLGMVDFDSPMKIDEQTVLEMEWLKTGILLEFSAKSGAMLGLGSSDGDDARVKTLSDFAGNCGRAFQLQDDILGIVGNEKSLGKPIGSDIREGKKTVIVLHALKNAEQKEKTDILTHLGNRTATDSEVKYVSSKLQELGGVDYARDMANSYIAKTTSALDQVPDSKFKELLLEWADFMVNREL